MEIDKQAKALLVGNKIVKAYLHSDKSNMYNCGEEDGLTEKQLENFVYALYEVEFELIVDKEGNAKVLTVDGKMLEDKA